MKFRVEFRRVMEWDEEVEVPEDLCFFVDDDHMDMGLVPESEAKVRRFLIRHGKEQAFRGKIVADEDDVSVNFEPDI